MGLEKPHKRIIICCDGTWQASDRPPTATPDKSSTATPEKSSTATSQDSNVTRFSRALSKTATTIDGQKVPQIVYYVSGIGTTGFTKISHIVAGGLGWGLSENVIEGYNFLALNYEPDDEIFLFGFSRGAYTARALAGLISSTGILSRENLDYSLDLYKAYKAGEKELSKFQLVFKPKYKPEDAKIKVVGCWDTVGSLGIPDSWFTWATGANKHDSFHDTQLSDKIENAFHALALDEHRKPFSPTLWNLPEEGSLGESSKTNLVQCWFPGVHTSVGGGNADGLKDSHGLPFEQLADITFVWMVEMCRPFLEFNSGLQKKISERKEGGPKWGLGSIKDSYVWYYHPTGKLIRSPGQYNPGESNVSDLQYVAERSREYIHSSVRVRDVVHERGKALAPKDITWGRSLKNMIWSDPLEEITRGDALKDFNRMPDTEVGKDDLSSGWKWVKELGNGKKVEIPEMRIMGDFERSLMSKEALEIVREGIKSEGAKPSLLD